MQNWNEVKVANAKEKSKTTDHIGLGIIVGPIGDIWLWDLVNKGNLRDFVTLRNIPHTLYSKYWVLDNGLWSMFRHTFISLEVWLSRLIRSATSDYGPSHRLSIFTLNRETSLSTGKSVPAAKTAACDLKNRWYWDKLGSLSYTIVPMWSAKGGVNPQICNSPFAENHFRIFFWSI